MFLKNLLLIFLLIPTVIFSQSIVDVVVDSPDHNTLETAVTEAGLIDALSGEGPFTLFAPTDAAFDLLPEGALEDLLEDPTGQLAEILKYHVVAGTAAASTDLSDGQIIPTLQGKDINVTVNANGVFINDIEVIVADIVADNGIVHVIDMVLLPPVTTIVDIVVNSPDHNTLETAVTEAGLIDALSGEGPFTLFAPTDAAFDLLPEGALEDLLEDPTGQLAEILKYHVVAGTAAASTDLSDGQIIPTLQGKDINVTVNANGVFINDIEVIVADIVADNGIVHVIDMVLLPPVTTIVDIVVNSPDHETLESLVIAADLAGTLSGEGPFTLFAPTDDAFALVPADIITELQNDPTGKLRDVLLYHAVSGSVSSDQLSDGQIVETVLGQTVEVSIEGSEISINTAVVTVADIVADNGIVHVINAVLVPSNVLNVSLPQFDQFIAGPNPVAERLNISIQSDSQEATTFEIVNHFGQLIKVKTDNAKNISWDMSDLPAGTYYLKVSNSKNYSIKPIIKM